MTSSTRGGQVRILASLGDMDLGVQEIVLDEDGTLYWLATKKLMVLRKDEKAPIVDAEHVDAFAVDASYVYFSGSLEADRGKLRRHVKPSGPTETVVPRYWRADHSMRVVGDYVYGTQNAWRMKSAHPAYLVRARKTGGCTEIVTTLPNDNFNDIYADDTRLYWADSTKGEILTIPVR